MIAKIKKFFYGIFDYHEKVRRIEICDDILLSIFAFLTQPKCCHLELVTLRWHRLIGSIGNGLNMIHLVKTPILLLKIGKNAAANCNKKMKFGFFPCDEPKRKLPDPPNYVRCRHLRLKCTEMLAADFLAANGHILNFPIYSGQNIGTSVQISADITTEACVWPKLFSTFHAVDSLEFYLTEKPPLPVRALNEQKKKGIAQLRKKLKCNKINNNEFVEGCQYLIEQWRTQIRRLSDGKFGPTVEQLTAWLNCTCRVKVGGRRELFFGNATELMPETIRHLLLQNFYEFLNEGSSVDNKISRNNNNRGNQRTVVIWVLSDRIREMIEKHSAATADQNFEKFGQNVGQWVHFANPSTAANCRLKMEESHRGLSGELIMVQERH